MTLEIKRSYLEIKSLDDLNDSSKPSENYYIELIKEPDFQLNKFFTKMLEKNIDGQTDLFGLISNGLNISIIKI